MRVNKNQKDAELYNSAYENKEENEIKFFDGSNQRDTPTFRDIRCHLNNSPRAIEEKLRRDRMKVYDNLSNSAGGGSECKRVKQNLPYSDLVKIKKERAAYYHERKSSNMTLPKVNDSEDLVKYNQDISF